MITNNDFTFIAGRGGNGLASFYPKKKSGPDGGSGGVGGNIYIVIDNNVHSLDILFQKKTYKAGEGQVGGKNQKIGRNGEDLIVRFPKGTVLESVDSKEKIVLWEQKEKILLCKGGKGGLGNYFLKNPRNTTPKYFLPGLSGMRKTFKIYFRIPNEVALVGLSNSGKTSLLNAITNAKGLITDYPYATREPNLGVYDKKIIIDLPPVTKDGFNGKGFGADFLGHLEYSKLLCFCISATSEDPVTDFETIKEEIKIYNKTFLRKKIVIVLTKIDEITPLKLEEIKKDLKKYKKVVIPVSILEEKSLIKLKKRLDKI